MTKPLIVFDFDGVISNSIHDSYLTAMNSYIDFMPNHQLPLKQRIDPPQAVFDFEAEYPKLFDEFRHLLPFGNRAEDYFVFMQAMDKRFSDSIQTQDDFNRFKQSLDKEKMNSYHLAFYGLRLSRQKADPEEWSQLLPAFEGMVQTIQALTLRANVAIATSKDLYSVHLQLDHYGLRDYFPSDFILDKEYSHSKRDHLTHFHTEHKIPFENMHFIDDKFLHLLSVDDLPVHKYLAGWGYNSRREHQQTLEHGYTLLHLDQLPNIAR